MTVYFVSRHDGALRWARILQKQNALPFDIDAYVNHIDSQALRKGDVVIGTLPLREAQRLREHGVRFLNLDLQVPADLRGQELTATQMAACGATLTEYRVTVKESFELDPVRKQRAKRANPVKPAVTVMLVSQEIMAQYLGFLHAPTSEVILVVTPSMKQRARHLQALLDKAPQAPSKIHVLPLGDDGGYPELRAQADSLMDELLKQGRERIVINITGGTKLMSLAFSEAARAALREHDQLSIDYVDTAQARIERLDGAAPQPMRAVLGVADAVLASGKADAGCASASPLFQQQMQRTPLHDLLLDADPGFIGELNSLSMEMESARKGKKLKEAQWLDVGRSKPNDGIFVLRQATDSDHPARRMQRMLGGKFGRALHAHGVLSAPPSIDAGVMTLALARPSEIDYLKGGWLEAHIASIIRAAAPDDWACGVQIGSEAGKNNEIDAIVTCANRTLLCEIKTANLARPTTQDDGESRTKGQDTIYKLDSVGHDLARNFNDNWLISARYLSPDDLERARDKRILVFSPASKDTPAREAVLALKKALSAWIEANRARTPSETGQRFRRIPVSREWNKKQGLDDKSAAARHAQASGNAAPTSQDPGKKAAARRRQGATSGGGKAPARSGLNDKAQAALAAIKAERLNKTTT